MLWNLALTACIAVGGYLAAPAFERSPDDAFRRIEQQLIDSEDLRGIQRGLRQQPQDPAPSHRTPYRIHGGVGPASSSI